MNVGQRHADRSQTEPVYLGTGDPGQTGGNTVMSHDTEGMMQAYENIFGPAARDIKLDTQRHKRHQRWHLPDALKGASPFLTDRVDGLITDATSSPFTKNILPYMYMENPDRKIKWNVYSFDEGIASRVPYESAARVLPQSKRSFAGYAVRQGLAIAMEHNFMMSPAGMDNFRKQLMQLVGSIQLTNDLDVHMALLHAPSYQRFMDEKYYDTSKTIAQQCRMYVDLFGFLQKNENALDYLIEDAKNHLQAWGSKAPSFMLCNGALTKQLTMQPEKTNYITQGPDGKRRLASGPDLPSYRGLSFINSRQFSLEAGTAPRDIMRRRVRVMEHIRIAWEPDNLSKRYEFYDQSRDSMFYLSWLDLAKHCTPKYGDRYQGPQLRNENDGLSFNQQQRAARQFRFSTQTPAEHTENPADYNVPGYPQLGSFYGAFLEVFGEFSHDQYEVLGMSNGDFLPSYKRLNGVQDANNAAWQDMMVNYLHQGATYGFWSAPSFDNAMGEAHECHLLDDVTVSFYDNKNQRIADFHFKPPQLLEDMRPEIVHNMLVMRLRMLAFVNHDRQTMCCPLFDENYLSRLQVAPYQVGAGGAAHAYVPGDVVLRDENNAPVFGLNAAGNISQPPRAATSQWMQRAKTFNGKPLQPSVAGVWCEKSIMQPIDMLKIMSAYRLKFACEAKSCLGQKMHMPPFPQYGVNGKSPLHNIFAFTYNLDYTTDYDPNGAPLPGPRPWTVAANDTAHYNQYWWPHNIFAAAEVVSHEQVIIPRDILIWKPNIEHFMLGIIFGRGGGPEELGATFWGQTELSCYDDAQHGIWGMSYKYHERAIVTNEKNLIRVFDVCFDGYCGGNDSQIMSWTEEGVHDFRSATLDLTSSYAGPSMIVMALPVQTNTAEAFPNPCIFHYAGSLGPPQPDRGRSQARTDKYRPFDKPQGNQFGRSPAVYAVFQHYYNRLNIPNWPSVNQHQTPGTLSAAGETESYMYSFHGHFATINEKGMREEITGSGHLGPNFVGVASVREGRGLLPRGMPQLVHLA